MSGPIAGAKTLVVKVGSSLVTNDGRGLDVEAIARWASQIARLHELGKRCILVSSGAIAEGLQRLGWTRRPHAMHELQAAAAVGQMGLVQCYETCFREHGLATAQVLLTHADMADRRRYLNARSTLRTLLELGVIPVINENDTVVTSPTRSSSATTTRSAPWSQIWSKPTRSSSLPTRPGCTMRTRGVTRARSSSSMRKRAIRAWRRWPAAPAACTPREA